MREVNSFGRGSKGGSLNPHTFAQLVDVKKAHQSSSITRSRRKDTRIETANKHPPPERTLIPAVSFFSLSSDLLLFFCEKRLPVPHGLGETTDEFHQRRPARS